MGNKFLKILKNKEQDMRHILLDLLNTNFYRSTVELVENLLTGNPPTSPRETRHIYNKSRPWAVRAQWNFC